MNQVFKEVTLNNKSERLVKLANTKNKELSERQKEVILQMKSHIIKNIKKFKHGEGSPEGDKHY